MSIRRTTLFVFSIWWPINLIRSIRLMVGNKASIRSVLGREMPGLPHSSMNSRVGEESESSVVRHYGKKSPDRATLATLCCCWPKTSQDILCLYQWSIRSIVDNRQNLFLHSFRYLFSLWMCSRISLYDERQRLRRDSSQPPES